MNSIVFQEMRIVAACLTCSGPHQAQPGYADRNYGYMVIANVQNDKMGRQSKLDEIINNMPELEAATTSLRTG